MPTQPTASHSLSGRISNQQGNPLSGLTIRAYSRDEQSRDVLLGEATTNREGRYSIPYTWTRPDSRDRESVGPDVYILVLAADKQIDRSPLRRNVGQRDSIDMQVEMPEPDEPEETAMSVSGVVRQSDGRPLAGVVVRAAHKRLRTETSLGQESVTDPTGRYAITYEATELGPTDQERVNLVVRAFDREKELLVESPVFFQTRASQTVDLVVKAAEDTRSPYERLRQQLDPLLDGARLDELGDEEIRFLAGSSRIAAAEIARVVMAERAAKLTGLPAAAFQGYLTARQDEQRGALASFWRRLADDFGISPDDDARFRFLAQAGEIVSYEPALLEALRTQLDKEVIFSALDLALWDTGRWLTLLGSAYVDERLALPAWATGQTRDEQLRQAAAAISRQAAQVFPSQSISAVLVSGRVTTPNKRPAVEVAVQAFHHHVDKDVPISAKRLTDASGDYRLVIDPEVLKQRMPHLERLPLQFRVRAWLEDETSPVGQSEILPGARLPLKLDITLDREVGPTEYETVDSRIRFALDDAAVEQLSPDKLRWLTGATGLDLNAIQLYVDAHKLAAETPIPAEALYALSHPAVEQSKRPEEDTIDRRLRRGVEVGLVGKHVLEQVSALEKWAEQRKQDARKREIENRIDQLSKPAPQGRPATPVDILRAVELPDDALDTFIRTLAEHPEDDAATRPRRLAEAGVDMRERVIIGTALRLAELVGPNASLVGKLMRELPGPANSADDNASDAADEVSALEMDRLRAALAPLARRSAGQWLQELETHYPEQSAADRARQARAIQDRLEEIYPNEALLGRLEERIPAESGPRDELKTVDLPAIHRVLNGRRINLRGRGLPFQKLGDSSEAVRPQLESLQRLARVAPFAEAISLLEMGYTSAREIAIASEADFVDRLVDAVKRQPPGAGAADEELLRRKAQGIHRRAQVHVAEAVAVATTLRPETTAADPAAINGGKKRLPDSGPGATLETLFGAFDACSVETCESVLGQPAYLVDMLELLNIAGRKGRPNPQRVLEERRPDIFHLELSCANAQTPLPTIDLVIELLEDTVAPVQSAPASLSLEKEQSKLTPLLSNALLEKKSLSITDSQGSSDATAASRPRYRQTSWSAEELLAYPEHLNTAAYAKLALSAGRDAAVFPWTLPFSLSHEEADIYLDELETSRADLLRQLRREPATDDQRLEQACAELGLNPGMRRILLEQTGATQPWRFWGYAENSAPSGWPALVGVDAKVLLARTGLSYADLIELLATAYINPERAVGIVPEPGEDACDLSKTQLTNVNAPFLDRFHRFARLWLHLGCSVRELDRAIAIQSEPEINAGLLIALADARRVASRLKLPLAAVLPFWGDLDTQASLDRSTEPVRRKPSQYEALLLDKSKLAAAERRTLALPLDPGTSLDALAGPASTALGLDAADLALLRGPSPEWAIGEAAIAASAPLSFLSAIYRWRTLSQATNLSIRDLLRLRVLRGADPFASPEAALNLLDTLELIRHHGYSVDDLDFELRHVSTPERLRRFDEQGRRLLRRVRDTLLKQAPARPDADGFSESDVAAILCQEVAQLSRFSIGSVRTIVDQVESSILPTLTEWLQSESWLETDALDDQAWRDKVRDGTAWHAYVRLVKSARLYARMGLDEQALQEEGGALLDALQLPRPSNLPVAGESRTADECRALFHKWRELATLSILKRRLADRHLTFWSLWREAVQKGDGVLASWRIVAQQLGHAGVDVERLVGREFLRLSPPAGKAPPSVWIRFLDAMSLVTRLGVAVSELTDWLTDGLTLQTSAQIRAVASARLAPEQWRARAPQLRNRLRQKQRAALLAWVKHNHKANSIDELHTYYLVDLEIGPEQLTTRVALATASVQAFWQRALLGKERAADRGPVVLPRNFGEIWEWMKSYRAWSHARKVFLYPENFLTPEIRDDKTPFFVELEQQLSQRALSEEAIEDAIGQYLQKLDEVARLEIMGSCIEEASGGKILHIVGRTRSIPHSYYHRTWYMAGGGFTPWVKLDLDIDGDWVIPVVFQGRLTLYWVKHTIQIEGMADIVGLIPTRPFPLSPHYPMPQDQYTLSWSTRQRKGWTKKQIAERHIARPLNPLMPAQFAVRLDADRMRIAGVSLLPQPTSVDESVPSPKADPTLMKRQLRSTQSPFLLPSLPSITVPIRPPPGVPFIPVEFNNWLNSIKNGIYKWGDWVWENANGVWKWTKDSTEYAADVIKPYKDKVKNSINDPVVKTPLDVLQDILDQLEFVRSEIVEKLISLPGDVWEEFSTWLAELPANVWNELTNVLEALTKQAWALLPESIQTILKLIKEQIDKVVDVLTQPSIQDAPTRVLESMIKSAGQFVTSIATIVGEFLRLVKDAALTHILGSDLVEGIAEWFESVRSPRPGWAGPLPGFEFGFFDVGEGGARAIRLAPPPFVSGAILVGGGLAMAAVAAPLAPLSLLLSPLGPLAFLSAAPLLAMGLIAMSESARLIYSMFPGYPAFHDMPVLSGMLSTDLPIRYGSSEADDRIRAWPGSGFAFLPTSLGTLGIGTYCSIAVNLKQIALEEVQDLDFPLADGFVPTLNGVKDFANAGTGFMEGVADKLDDAAALLNVGMRVVRPLPFGAYPARLYNPSPTIISEDRHSRNFLLYQGVEENEKRVLRTWYVVSLYHPLTSILSRSFDRAGVPGLYASASRPGGEAWKHGDKEKAKKIFSDTFWVDNPFGVADPVTAGTASQEHLDLSQAGAYSLYNWELFFHIPLLIAGRLARQQSFAAALSWYRQIFDPTVAAGASPQRFWRFKQFHDDYADEQPYQRLIAWLRDLAEGTDDGERADVVAAWRRDPSNPHRIARMRDGAYARSVVMRTVDTLVNWGDARFREGSWEAVNEATQLYLLAREILGPRPQLVPARHAQALTYRQLASDQGQPSRGIGPFGNALLNIETALSPMAILDSDDPATPASSSGLTVLSGVSMLYFGVPANEQLLGLWDTIEDRLLKIRSGLDLKGRARTVPPPGLSLADITVPGSQFSGQINAQAHSGTMQVPPYRFQFMLQKAHEFVGEVKAFGAAVLIAAEKRDAEQLARLRAGHELTILQAMRQVRERQIVEAEHALAAVSQGLEGARIRFNYYSSKEFISAAEMVKEVLMGVSLGLNVASATSDALAAILTAFPQVKMEGSIGTDSSGKAAGDIGGIQLGGAASASARVFAALSSLAHAGSSMAGSIAHYQRRQEDWDHQASLAENDLEQFEEQIAGAKIRLEIAQRERDNQEQQIANASDVAAYMQEKFTNEELYEWMLEQASMLHFQSYLLAVDVARKAEWSFRYERLPLAASFITFENWNDLSGALMAGERLQHDLRRMEQVYLEHNTREHEITKHISLAQVDPVALLMLRQTGHCFVSLPEHLFDADHPGHYLRRIKSISLSIPSVVGPHTSVNCRLSLERSEIRVSTEIRESTEIGEDYPKRKENDERFRDVHPGAASPGFALSREMTALVTSGAQGDAGLFEQNLRDERYLPFEGAGAVSLWRLELPRETNRFDLATVSDVVMHMRYTARDGAKLRDAAWHATWGTDAPGRPDSEPMGQALPLRRLFSVRHDFPDAWHRFLHPADTQPTPVLDLDLSRDRFPYHLPETKLQLKTITLAFVAEPSSSVEGLVAALRFTPGGGGTSVEATPAQGVFAVDAKLAPLAACEYTPGDGSGLGQWQLHIPATHDDGTLPAILEVDATTNQVRLISAKLVDLFVLCSYELENG